MVAVTERPLILICDDDNAMRKVIAKVLQHEQFDVIDCDNGADAVALTTKHRPDLVLLDIVMPGQLGGLDTLRELADRRLAPVAMLTALHDERDRSAAARLEAIAFLNKAEVADRLGEHVRGVLADCARRGGAHGAS